MEPLINKAKLQKILESGLLNGKWSVLQFNKPGLEPILPSYEFLAENEQFTDMNYRDLNAFAQLHHATRDTY